MILWYVRKWRNTIEATQCFATWGSIGIGRLPELNLIGLLIFGSPKPCKIQWSFIVFEIPLQTYRQLRCRSI